MLYAVKRNFKEIQALDPTHSIHVSPEVIFQQQQLAHAFNVRAKQELILKITIIMY